MRSLKILFAFLFIGSFVACEKGLLDEEEEKKSSSGASTTIKGNLELNIIQLEKVSFQTITKASTEEFPTHLCFAIYDMSGTRIKQLNQQLLPASLALSGSPAVYGSDANLGSMADLGHASFNLEKGTYQIVALAHSSTKNPTMTNLAKVQFNNSIGYTDTYLYYTALTVTDEPLSLDLTLDRICALCRFVISDSIPDGVSQVKFQYKGGSGHFSALTGLGVTNSTQVVTRQVQPGQQYLVFDLYTFLHQQEGLIELTATALTASGEEYCAWEFTIPMRKNQITWLTGNFFSKESSGQWRVFPNIALDKTWAREVFFTY